MPPEVLSAVGDQPSMTCSDHQQLRTQDPSLATASGASYFDSWDLQVEQRPLPWNDITESVDPQKMQVFSSFWRTIDDPSIEIDSWSPSRMLNSRRVSAGITIRPRSSILRAIPDSMREVSPEVGGATIPTPS